MNEISYKQAKEMLCEHLRKILNLLEKTNIECSDGHEDRITCPECASSMNLSDGFEAEDFGKAWPVGDKYPIDEIKIKNVYYEITDDFVL